MKTNHGFISNSSSSSFMIYGTSLKDSEIFEIAKKMFSKTDEELEEAYGGSAGELCEEISSKMGLECHIMEYSGKYIGSSWDSIGDDETGKQFKESVQSTIKEFLPNAVFGTHEEVWYNG